MKIFMCAAIVAAAGVVSKCGSEQRGPSVVVIVGDGRTFSSPACPGSSGWGDAMPQFFQAGVVATNFASDKNGQAVAMRPTFVIAGFGQGDAEAKTPLPDFRNRIQQLIAAAKKINATPVLVTPPVLRTNDPVSAKTFTNMPPPADAQPYADAIREIGAAEKVTVLDLRGEMQKTYREIGDRACWFLHPPADITKEVATNVRTNREWRGPKPRNPQYFSSTGADTLAQWIATLIRESDSSLRNLLRDPAGPPSPDYKLVWSDEFDGSTWTNNWSCRDPGKRKDGFNDPACIRLDGEGHLVIDVRRETNGVHAGIASTDRKHQWKYGYFECRCTIADDDGYWSAFWMMSNHVGDPQSGRGKIDDTANNGTEIDICECMKVQGDVVHQNLHWNGYGDDHKSSPFDTFVPDLRKQKWHVFAVDWRPDGYTFYVDGRRAWETTDAISQTEEYIILSIEIGKWAGDVSKAKLPQQVMFDWVRVYQRPAK